MNNIIINNPSSKYSLDAKQLLEDQKKEWALLSDNYKALDEVQTKEFIVGGSNLLVQFNPARIKSSAAKVDAVSIQNRPCFLCKQNLFAEQKGIDLFGKYQLLCNPYPIFSEHFTIPHIDHIPQRIENSFADLLQISKLLDNYVIFYNGANCGASAPDHLHFQAGNKGFMTIEFEYPFITSHGESVATIDGIKIIAVKNFSRKFFAFESSSSDLLSAVFAQFYRAATQLSDSTDEPMLNILSYFENDAWRVIIFPRGKHRPWQYFAEGNDKLVFSPASVDFGGVCILPRKEDFDKMDDRMLNNLFEQVTIDDSVFDRLSSCFKLCCG